MAEKKMFDVEGREDALLSEKTGPCPPLNEVNEDEQPDTVLGKESDADFDAEETNAKETNAKENPSS